MGKTIIQTIGPLYGEVVNGTVFGRPNGSIYIPSANVISLEIPAGREYVRNSGQYIVICSSTGNISWSDPNQQLHIVAESQDLANYVSIELAEDSDFTTLVGTANLTAGSFNVRAVAILIGTEYEIENGTTYYLRAVLYSGSGVAVAVSSSKEVAGVVV